MIEAINLALGTFIGRNSIETAGVLFLGGGFRKKDTAIIIDAPEQKRVASVVYAQLHLTNYFRD